MTLDYDPCRVTTQMSVVCSREVGSSSLVVVIKYYYYCIVLLSSKSWKLKHMLQLHDASSSLGFRVGSSTNIYPLPNTHISSTSEIKKGLVGLGFCPVQKRAGYGAMLIQESSF